MSRPSVKLQRVSDLHFFFSWDVLPVLVGTVCLAVLELGTLPARWPLHWFIEDYKIQVIILLGMLIVLPPPIANGFNHLKDREAAVARNVEAAAGYRGLGSRAANLIGKIRESIAGTVTDQYQTHLLIECQKYFESRPMPDGTDRPDDFRVETSYYGLKVNSRSKLLERKLFTHSDASRMRSTFSNRTAGEGLYAVEKISAGEYVFCADVADAKYAAPLSILDGESREYRTFLSLPVMRDRKSVGDQRVIGMLSVNVTHLGVIHESDHNILEVYAWFLSAAFEADSLARTSRGVSQPSGIHSVNQEGGSQ